MQGLIFTLIEEEAEIAAELSGKRRRGTISKTSLDTVQRRRCTIVLKYSWTGVTFSDKDCQAKILRQILSSEKEIDTDRCDTVKLIPRDVVDDKQGRKQTVPSK